MKGYMYCAGIVVALFFTHCIADSASAQGSSRPRDNSGSESNSFTHGSSSTSSSISFEKDGKLVSIKENGSEITVTVDGESVRARNVDELKHEHPDAYQLYVEKPGFAVGSAGGSASGSGRGSSSTTKGSHPGSLETKSSDSEDRSVTVTDNGQKVTITENASGITVTVGKKSFRAQNATELKKKSAKAFKLYEKHLNNSNTQREGTDAETLLQGNFEGRPNASNLLAEKLKEMQNEKSDDPRVQQLIQRMLRELDK
jgi:hypothetical protein